MKFININEEALKMNLNLEIVSDAFKTIIEEQNKISFYSLDDSEIIISDSSEIQRLINRLEKEDVQIITIAKEHDISKDKMSLVVENLITQYNLDGTINTIGEYITKNSLKNRIGKIIEENEDIDLNKQSIELGLSVEKIEQLIFEYENQIMYTIKPFSKFKLQDLSHEIGISKKMFVVFLKWLIRNNKINGSIDMVNETYIQDPSQRSFNYTLSNPISDSKYKLTHIEPIQTVVSVSQVSSLWYFLPILFGLIGGIIGYVLVVDRDREMANNLIIEGIITTVLYWIIFGLF